MYRPCFLEFIVVDQSSPLSMHLEACKQIRKIQQVYKTIDENFEKIISDGGNHLLSAGLWNASSGGERNVRDSCSLHCYGIDIPRIPSPPQRTAFIARHHNVEWVVRGQLSISIPQNTGTPTWWGTQGRLVPREGVLRHSSRPAEHSSQRPKHSPENPTNNLNLRLPKLFP